MLNDLVNVLSVWMVAPGCHDSVTLKIAICVCTSWIRAMAAGSSACSFTRSIKYSCQGDESCLQHRALASTDYMRADRFSRHQSTNSVVSAMLLSRLVTEVTYTTSNSLLIRATYFSSLPKLLPVVRDSKAEVIA